MAALPMAQALENLAWIQKTFPLLAERANQPANQMSGGEQQIVAIARAVSTMPKLLLLDEPLAALDHARKQEVLPWLEKLRDDLNIPMLYVTHAVDEVARLADTLVVMNEGRVQANGPVAEVLTQAELPVVVGEDAGALLTGIVLNIDTQWHLAQVGFVGKFVGSAHHFGVGLVQITELGLQHRKAGRCRIGCSRASRQGSRGL